MIETYSKKKLQILPLFLLVLIPSVLSIQIDEGVEIKPTSGSGYYTIKNTTFLDEMVVDDSGYFYNSTYVTLVWNYDNSTVDDIGSNATVPATNTNIINISVVSGNAEMTYNYETDDSSKTLIDNASTAIDKITGYTDILVLVIVAAVLFFIIRKDFLDKFNRGSL